MSELKQAIKRLAKTNTGFDAVLELATVKSVDEAAMTCSVVLFDNTSLLLEGVKLKPVVAGLDATQMGAVLYPEIDSDVIIGQINGSDTDLFVVMTSKVRKISFDAGSAFKMIIDMQSGAMAFDLTKMVFNAGKKGGLPMVNPIKEKFNQLEQKVNDLISDFKSHKHIGVTPGAGVSGFGDKQDIAKIDNITKLEELENKAIQQ